MSIRSKHLLNFCLSAALAVALGARVRQRCGGRRQADQSPAGYRRLLPRLRGPEKDPQRRGLGARPCRMDDRSPGGLRHQRQDSALRGPRLGQGLRCGRPQRMLCRRARPGLDRARAQAAPRGIAGRGDPLCDALLSRQDRRVVQVSRRHVARPRRQLSVRGDQPRQRTSHYERFRRQVADPRRRTVSDRKNVAGRQTVGPRHEHRFQEVRNVHLDEPVRRQDPRLRHDHRAPQLGDVRPGVLELRDPGIVVGRGQAR